MLTPASVADRAGQLGGRIWTASEGNPLVAVEMMREIQERGLPESLALPGRVRDVISRRIERVGERSRSLLTVAAAIGREFDFEMLRLVGELDDDTTPLEAGLDRFVDLDAGRFLGAEALRAQRAAGVARKLVGFELVGRGVAREGYPILHAGAEVGRVTSGAPSPTLGKSIGLGYVPPAFAPVGTELAVRIRDQAVPARVVPTPFVGRR